MSAVHSYIYQQEENIQEIMLFLNELLMKMPGMTARIRYQIPFYYRKSWICYINLVKGSGVELAFLRGNELSNEQGILDFKGRKQVSGITFNHVSEVNEEILIPVLQEALLLDDSIPYASKRKKADKS